MFDIGEIVKCDDKVCLISDIIRTLGFNQYLLMDMDTGHTLKAFGYQLAKCQEIADALVTELMDAGEAEIVSVVETSEPKRSREDDRGRWAEMSEESLNQLAENRHSKSTASQTKWAVKAFQGTVTP